MNITDTAVAQNIANLEKAKEPKIVWLLAPMQDKGLSFNSGHAFKVDRIHLGLASEVLRFYLKGEKAGEARVAGDIEALEQVIKDRVKPEKIDHSDFAYLFAEPELGEDGNPVKPEEAKSLVVGLGKIKLTAEHLELDEFKDLGYAVGDEVEIVIRDDSRVKELEADLEKVKGELYNAKEEVKGRDATIAGLNKSKTALQAKLAKATEKTARANTKKKKVVTKAEATKIEKEVKAEMKSAGKDPNTGQTQAPKA